MSCQPGDTLGNFRLMRELGRGATGTVFLAEQLNLGRECALKVLAPELVRDQSFLDRFQREGKIAASLRHKNIVCIFDLVIAGPHYALAMDYINGQELKGLMATEKKLPQQVALDIIINVLDALDYAHSRGIVHRDVKPANILVEPDGSVFLADFSIARLAGSDKLTKTGMVIGTPEYMAPEQFDGKEVDARVDVYATALILYEMLSGQNPFCGDTLAEVIKKQVLTEPPSLDSLVEVPAGLVEIVHKGLAKSPDRRYQSAGEMRRALLDLGQPVQASAGSLTQFLQSVELGAISMDAAVIARDKVKDAIDKGFKRRLTIVMLDLAGSSKIKIPNQTLIADRAFQDYRQTINAILEEYGVERYDWSGDGAISLFPDPISGVDAAVKVQRTVSEVGARHVSLPDSLKVRIGIRTGMVYYDPRRTLGEFASRTVDQAGHLEKDCPPGSIRLGDVTMQALGDRYHLEHKGTNRDDIDVYELDVHSPENLERIYEGSSQPRPAPLPARESHPNPISRLSTSPSSPSLSTNPLPHELDSRKTNPMPQPVSQPVPQGPSAAIRHASPAEPMDSRRYETNKDIPSQPESANKVGRLPKVEVGPVGAASVSIPETSDHRSPAKRWWGWNSLGVLFLIWSGSGLLYEGFGLGEDLFGSSGALFLLHLAVLPFYCLLKLITGESSKAKEAARAGAVFLLLSVVMRIIQVS